MAELGPGPARLQLCIGPAVPVPVTADVIDALTSVKVECSSGETASGFELTFSIPHDSPIQALFAISVPVFRCVIAVTLRGVTEVLMDGVITNVALAANGPVSTLSVKGKDLSQVMDIIPFDGVPYPAMSPVMRALFVLGKYAALGCVPVTIPSIIEEFPVPTESIPSHHGTDLAYLKQLAANVGYTFYVDPGPVIGVSTAYWGPEIRVGVPQPALTFGLGRTHDNCTALSFTFDREKKKMPVVTILEPTTHAPIPIPIPDVTPMNPPLALVPPLPPTIVPLNDTASLSPAQAIMKGIAYSAQNSDAVTGTGTLDLARYGRVLKARQLVGVRGAGFAFDGLYYVTKVAHELKRGSYTQQFTLGRDGFVSNVPAVAV